MRMAMAGGDAPQCQCEIHENWTKWYKGFMHQVFLHTKMEIKKVLSRKKTAEVREPEGELSVTVLVSQVNSRIQFTVDLSKEAKELKKANIQDIQELKKRIVQVIKGKIRAFHYEDFYDVAPLLVPRIMAERKGGSLESIIDFTNFGNIPDAKVAIMQRPLADGKITALKKALFSKWGFTGDLAFHLASYNMYRLWTKGEKQFGLNELFETVKAGVYKVKLEGIDQSLAAATLFTMAKFMDDLDVDGDLVIVIPVPSVLLVTGSRNYDGLCYMGEHALSQARSKELITTKPIRIAYMGDWKTHEPNYIPYRPLLPKGEGSVPENAEQLQILTDGLSRRARATKLAAMNASAAIGASAPTTQAATTQGNPPPTPPSSPSRTGATTQQSSTTARLEAVRKELVELRRENTSSPVPKEKQRRSSISKVRSGTAVSEGTQKQSSKQKVETPQPKVEAPSVAPSATKAESTTDAAAKVKISSGNDAFVPITKAPPSTSSGVTQVKPRQHGGVSADKQATGQGDVNVIDKQGTKTTPPSGPTKGQFDGCKVLPTSATAGNTVSQVASKVNAPTVSSQSSSCITPLTEPTTTQQLSSVTTVTTQIQQTDSKTSASHSSLRQKTAPVLSDCQRPVLTTNQRPVVTTNQQPVVTTNQQPVVMTNQQPVVMTNQRPVVMTNQRPVVMTNQQLVVMTNQRPVVTTNQRPVVTTMEQTEKPAEGKRLESVAKTSSTPKVRNSTKSADPTESPTTIAKQVQASLSVARERNQIRDVAVKQEHTQSIVMGTIANVKSDSLKESLPAHASTNLTQAPNTASIADSTALSTKRHAASASASLKPPQATEKVQMSKPATSSAVEKVIQKSVLQQDSVKPVSPQQVRPEAPKTTLTSQVNCTTVTKTIPQTQSEHAKRTTTSQATEKTVPQSKLQSAPVKPPASTQLQQSATKASFQMHGAQEKATVSTQVQSTAVKQLEPPIAAVKSSGFASSQPAAVKVLTSSQVQNAAATSAVSSQAQFTAVNKPSSSQEQQTAAKTCNDSQMPATAAEAVKPLPRQPSIVKSVTVPQFGSPKAAAPLQPVSSNVTCSPQMKPTTAYPVTSTFKQTALNSSTETDSIPEVKPSAKSSVVQCTAVQHLTSAQTKIPDSAQTKIPDSAQTKIPDSPRVKILDLSQTKVLDSAQTTIPDLSQTKILESVQTKIPDSAQTKIPVAAQTKIPESTQTNIPDSKPMTRAVPSAVSKDVTRAQELGSPAQQTALPMTTPVSKEVTRSQESVLRTQGSTLPQTKTLPDKLSAPSKMQTISSKDTSSQFQPTAPKPFPSSVLPATPSMEKIQAKPTISSTPQGYMSQATMVSPANSMPSKHISTPPTQPISLKSESCAKMIDVASKQVTSVAPKVSQAQTETPKMAAPIPLQPNATPRQTVSLVSEPSVSPSKPFVALKQTSVVSSKVISEHIPPSQNSQKMFTTDVQVVRPKVTPQQIPTAPPPKTQQPIGKAAAPTSTSQSLGTDVTVKVSDTSPGRRLTVKMVQYVPPPPRGLNGPTLDTLAALKGQQQSAPRTAMVSDEPKKPLAKDIDDRVQGVKPQLSTCVSEVKTLISTSTKAAPSSDVQSKRADEPTISSRQEQVASTPEASPKTQASHTGTKPSQARTPQQPRGQPAGAELDGSRKTPFKIDTIETTAAPSSEKYEATKALSPERARNVLTVKMVPYKPTTRTSVPVPLAPPCDNPEHEKKDSSSSTESTEVTQQCPEQERGRNGLSVKMVPYKPTARTSVPAPSAPPCDNPEHDKKNSPVPTETTKVTQDCPEQERGRNGLTVKMVPYKPTAKIGVPGPSAPPCDNLENDKNDSPSSNETDKVTQDCQEQERGRNVVSAKMVPYEPTTKTSVPVTLTPPCDNPKQDRNNSPSSTETAKATQVGPELEDKSDKAQIERNVDAKTQVVDNKKGFLNPNAPSFGARKTSEMTSSVTKEAKSGSGMTLKPESATQKVATSITPQIQHQGQQQRPLPARHDGSHGNGVVHYEGVAPNGQLQTDRGQMPQRNNSQCKTPSEVPNNQSSRNQGQQHRTQATWDSNYPDASRAQEHPGEQRTSGKGQTTKEKLASAFKPLTDKFQQFKQWRKNRNQQHEEPYIHHFGRGEGMGDAAFYVNHGNDCDQNWQYGSHDNGYGIPPAEQQGTAQDWTSEQRRQYEEQARLRDMRRELFSYSDCPVPSEMYSGLGRNDNSHYGQRNVVNPVVKTARHQAPPQQNAAPNEQQKYGKPERTSTANRQQESGYRAKADGNPFNRATWRRYRERHEQNRGPYRAQRYEGMVQNAEQDIPATDTQRPGNNGRNGDGLKRSSSFSRAYPRARRRMPSGGSATTADAPQPEMQTWIGGGRVTNLPSGVAPPRSYRNRANSHSYSHNRPHQPSKPPADNKPKPSPTKPVTAKKDNSTHTPERGRKNTLTKGDNSQSRQAAGAPSSKQASDQQKSTNEKTQETTKRVDADTRPKTPLDKPTNATPTEANDAKAEQTQSDQTEGVNEGEVEERKALKARRRLLTRKPSDAHGNRPAKIPRIPVFLGAKEAGLREEAWTRALVTAEEDPLGTSLCVQLCFYCGVVGSWSEEVVLRKCSKCGTATYCSRKCQWNHWNDHKSKCRDLTTDHQKFKVIIQL